MPVGTDISAQQGMIQISETKKKSHGTRPGEYGTGGGEAKQLLFLSSKNAVTILEV